MVEAVDWGVGLVVVIREGVRSVEMVKGKGYVERKGKGRVLGERREDLE